MSGVDEKTRSTVQSIPMCTVNAGPRDGDKWVARLKEEFTALIKVRLTNLTARLRLPVTAVRNGIAADD